MKKVPVVFAVIFTALVLLGTISFYILKNNGNGSLYIRTLEPSGSASSEQSASFGDPPAAEETDGRMDINAATLAELMTLPGIGETLAQRIIDYRTAYGPFSGPTELLNVSGIGEKKLEAILDLITTGGNT